MKNEAMKEAIQVIFCHLVVIIIYVPMHVYLFIGIFLLGIFNIIKEIIYEIKDGILVENYKHLFDIIARKITRGKYEK